MYRSRLSITYLFALLACGAAVAQGRTLVEVHEADLQQLARTRRPFKDSVAPAKVLSQLSAISAVALDVPDLTGPFLGKPDQPAWKIALARLYAASLWHVLAELPSVTFLSLLRALHRELLAAAPFAPWCFAALTCLSSCRTLLELRHCWVSGRRGVAQAHHFGKYLPLAVQKAFARRGAAGFLHTLALFEFFSLQASSQLQRLQPADRSFLYVVGWHRSYIGQGGLLRKTGSHPGPVARFKEHVCAWRQARLKKSAPNRERYLELVRGDGRVDFYFLVTEITSSTTANALESAKITWCSPEANNVCEGGPAARKRRGNQKGRRLPIRQPRRAHAQREPPGGP